MSLFSEHVKQLKILAGYHRDPSGVASEDVQGRFCSNRPRMGELKIERQEECEKRFHGLRDSASSALYRGSIEERVCPPQHSDAAMNFYPFRVFSLQHYPVSRALLTAPALLVRSPPQSFLLVFAQVLL